MNGTTFYVVRHGQTEFNVKNIIGGTLEPNPLSKIGRQQAVKLALKLLKIKIDLIYSSDLTRAIETAEIIADSKKLHVKTDPLLRERFWGSLQGKTFDEAKAEYEESFRKEAIIEGLEAMNFKYVPDMESLFSTVNRFNSFLKKSTADNPGKTILIVCHFDIMIGFLVSIGYGTYQKLMNSTFNHTGYYKLYVEDSKFSIKEIKGLNT